jgi:hypothetical protein
MNEKIGPIAEILEGVFYREQGELFVPGHESSVAACLAGFKDKAVLVSLHHTPPDPPDVQHWGAGCCMWEPTGQCPYGHHHDPNKMYHLRMEGVLRREGPDWYVGLTRLEFDPLEGHKSRLVITLTEPPVELTESLMDMDLQDVDPEALSQRLNKLQGIMSGLSSILDEAKKGGDRDA